MSEYACMRRGGKEQHFENIKEKKDEFYIFLEIWRKILTCMCNESLKDIGIKFMSKSIMN